MCHLCHDNDARCKWDKGLASSKTFLVDGKLFVNHVVNESPWKTLINNRDHIEKKLHFRDKNDNDAHYCIVSAVPDELFPKVSGVERIEVFMSIAKVSLI
jgi:phenolic acid decarboxylase